MRKILFLAVSICLLTSCQRASFLEISGNKNTPIIGGESASVQDFPFIVNIWQNSPNEGFNDHLCGGSLVASKWVLTAAHCVLEDTTDTTVGTVKVSTLTLFIGSDYRDGNGARAHKVKNIVVHPDFSWPLNDIALIELTEEVTNASPIELNSVKDLSESKTPLFATSAGWGKTDAVGSQEGAHLRKVSMPIINREACSNDWLTSRWPIGSEVICTKSFNETKAPCQGDSGGPLVLEYNGQQKLIGVVSWGHSCRGTNPNLISNVEGFADVANALPWIKKHINQAR